MANPFDIYATEEVEIPYIDRAFASTYGKSVPEQLFLSYLFAASRSGHLSVQVGAEGILPDPTELYGCLHLIEQYREQVVKGAHQLDPSLPVIYAEGGYRLERLHAAREKVLKEWKRLTEAETTQTIALPKEGLESLTEEQRQAVQSACVHSPFILTGGPGTGKTFTASRILKALIEGSSGRPFRIAIAAPTGKAALHMANVMKKGLDYPFESMTLHRLIRQGSSVLPYDLYLIDESSMIDLELMAEWLPKVKTSARIILLGDPHQLPPVECGSLFAELCRTHPHSVKLTRCLRAELTDLVACAEQLLQSGTFHASESVQLHPHVSRLEPFLEGFLDWFPVNADHADRELFSHFEKFRILSPLRKGKIGVDHVNRFILAKLYSRHQNGCFPIPIMVTKNDAKLDLFNGEMGILLTRHAPFEPLTPDDLIHFPNGRTLPALLLSDFDYGYAMTVHKSQGSEFDQVLLLLGDDPLSKKKELLYTAATRARKKLTVAFC